MTLWDGEFPVRSITPWEFPGSSTFPLPMVMGRSRVLPLSKMAAASSSSLIICSSNSSIIVSGVVEGVEASSSFSTLQVGSSSDRSTLSSIWGGTLKWSLLEGDRLIVPSDSIESQALRVRLTGSGILDVISA